jgi:hypothetical protein
LVLKKGGLRIHVGDGTKAESELILRLAFVEDWDSERRKSATRQAEPASPVVKLHK